MLTEIPAQIARASRQVVMRHPNSMACTVYRKEVLREAAENTGGLPTLGGIGVLDSEDEPAYQFVEIGDGRILFSGTYVAAPGNVIDSDDGALYSADPMECRVEPLVEGAFVADKHDQIQVQPGNGFIMSYEIVGITSPTSIPPYIRKLLVEPRQDQNVGI